MVGLIPPLLVENITFPAICFIFAGNWELLRSSCTISQMFKAQIPIKEYRRLIYVKSSSMRDALGMLGLTLL